MANSKRIGEQQFAQNKKENGSRTSSTRGIGKVKPFAGIRHDPAKVMRLLASIKLLQLVINKLITSDAFKAKRLQGLYKHLTQAMVAYQAANKLVYVAWKFLSDLVQRIRNHRGFQPNMAQRRPSPNVPTPRAGHPAAVKIAETKVPSTRRSNLKRGAVKPLGNRTHRRSIKCTNPKCKGHLVKDSSKPRTHNENHRA